MSNLTLNDFKHNFYYVVIDSDASTNKDLRCYIFPYEERLEYHIFVNFESKFGFSTLEEALKEYNNL